MIKYLNSAIFDIIFSKIYPKVKTGKDKITKAKFSTIKHSEYNIIIKKSCDCTYTFTPFKKINSASNRSVFIPSIRDRILIEILKISLSKKFRVSFSNRDRIIHVIKTKLESNNDYSIFKFDIKKFFESIPQNNLLHKIKKSSILSIQEYHLVKELLKNTPNNGVPMGLSVSSILSEIYMEEFDRTIKRYDQRIACYYRYVDDILVLFNGKLKDNEVKEFKSNIKLALVKLGLKINHSKYFYDYIPSKADTEIKFTFLGYEFIKKDKNTYLGIAPTKLEKIYSNVDFIFKDHSLYPNLDLLNERLCFITRKNTMLRYNYRFKNNLLEKKHHNLVIYGIIENYKYAHEKQFEDLDKYVHRKMHTTLGQVSNKSLFQHSFIDSITKNKINLYHKKDNNYYIQKIIRLNPSADRALLNMMNRQLLEKEYRKLLCL